jgi:CHAT domain-containing protein
MDAEQAGDYATAEQALDETIRLARQLRVTSREIAGLQTNMAEIVAGEGQFDSAETLLKQALGNLDTHDRRGAVYTTDAYFVLGRLYMQEGRLKDAEVMLQRAVETSPKKDDRDRLATLEIQDALAGVLVDEGRSGEAVPFYNEELALYRRDPKRFAEEIAAVSNHLAIINQTRFQETGDPEAFKAALAGFDEDLETNMRLFGRSDPRTIIALSNRGVLLGLGGRYGEAEPALQEAYARSKETFGEDSLKVAHAANNLAWAELGAKNAAAAAALFRPSLSLYLKQRALQQAAPNARGYAASEREVSRTILGLLRSLRALADAEPDKADALADEAFVAAQSVHSAKAAQAIALMTARFAAEDNQRADLIRRRQDLADQLRSLDDALTASLGQPLAQRDRSGEQSIRKQIASGETALAALDGDLAAAAPDYARLANPKPLTAAEARQRLKPDEALILVTAFGYGNGEDGFTFVVTREGIAFRSIGVGIATLLPWVTTLRCGLDDETWDDKDFRALCAQLTGGREPSPDLPFNAGLAHKLYVTLFGELSPKLEGKTLLVSWGEPLSTLPLEILVKEPPSDDYPAGPALAKLAWVGRSNPIAVLPSPASLRGLESAHPSVASEAFLGFGDPVLEGTADCGTTEALRECPSAGAMSSAMTRAPRRGPVRIEVGARGNGEMASLDAVRSLCPLPETAFELSCVAKSVGSAPDALHVGPNATLPEFRKLPLNRYRILHFATHGLLAGDLETASGKVAEPALVLTPPAAPTPGDDGLLRSSEIATLNLDADWVVLSACNTAAGQELGGEAMSGLASAFLFAGARSLLVSHWPVASGAAVFLTTTTFSELAAHPDMTRAEALRRAIDSMIDHPRGGFAHPSIWGPFSLVGQAGPILR